MKRHNYSVSQLRFSIPHITATMTSTYAPVTCPHCGSTDTSWKTKASLWECQSCEERFPGSPPVTAHRVLGERAARPKAIFFSYGHDAHRELVERFQADLEKRGHKDWIDSKEIRTWDDWKGRITRGINDSELAIAFLSRHAMRDPGVCRNEIAIAMNRFGTVYPVLLEAGIESDIPVTIRNLQWPDLSQWRAIRDGQVPGVEWERWYEEKLVNLIERLEGEATTFADETHTLRRALRPSSFESKIAQHVPGFIGRDWVFDAYRQWLDDAGSRLFWIKAGPGVGKSAIAANLASRERSAIVASWFIDAKSNELRNPGHALRSLAFQLAQRWEDYRVRLMRQLQLGANATDEKCDEVWRELGTKNTQDLFRFLLAEPLNGLIWREHKLVIVIDALDEGSDGDGHNRIAELIGLELNSLPDWIGFVVTSRPEADVVNRLQGFKPFVLDASDPRNRADLVKWYRAHLSTNPTLAALPPAQQAETENLLVERSEGMILYLKVVEEGLREGSLTVAQLGQLEAGLPGLYRRYYDSFMLRFGQDYETAAKPLLRLLLAAAGALPEDLASAVLQWNEEQFLASRNRLGSFVTDTPDGQELFHKTLREWLDSPASGPFFLDAGIGRQAIADVLFAEVGRSEAYALRWRDIIRSWLPQWLPRLDQRSDAAALNNLASALNDLGDFNEAEPLLRAALDMNQAALPAGDPAIAANLNNLANLLDWTGRYDVAESLYREALEMRRTALPPRDPDIAASLNNLATLLDSTGRYDEAESLYDEALKMLRAAVPAEPRKIAGAFNNLAGLLHSTGRAAEAEPLYREALGIYRAALPAGRPDIATSLNNLANLLDATGRYDEAESLYREALEIRRTALPPGHRDIADSLDSLAGLLVKTDRKAEAEPLYREALEMRRAAVPAEPRKITEAFNNLAGLLHSTGRAAEAEALYREALEMRRAALPPGHRDIADSLDSLAGLLVKTDRKAEAEPHYREALGIYRTALLAEPRRIAATLNNLAILLISTGRDSEGYALHQEALELYRGSGHPI